MFWSFTQIFLICEAGQTLTNQFKMLNSAIFECDWYTFPTDLQHIFPIIIMGTQKPVVICGFGNILCTREAFQNVSVIFY